MQMRNESGSFVPRDTRHGTRKEISNFGFDVSDSGAWAMAEEKLAYRSRAKDLGSIGGHAIACRCGSVPGTGAGQKRLRKSA
jgi:hypothetical protein